ncbi:ABC transporter substrate-binding protein [Escherichia marmotae]|uniref:ABC transporter substrate-binding protein n=1 Tax=Escherichia marmotae TaxID=1499973 RepID=UPI0015E4CD23|nr:ABC transporter substrate-binding protein [Escherichia marmotae]MBA7740513.1 ABC transporter substrate-binding protein [Escherichia marmotae]MBA7954646.1 ABC transporter substrate-binding protein [Escherichia marmotae]MED9089282.1 ABC transporter substrate-binding protein [Escherichia marmotae]MED9362086.1 ABC transporter substrate-binding protein [Escherichia marmotae]MED9495302.1 ABC transporter substrate-binding protein [Escherichia marmotae]
MKINNKLFLLMIFLLSLSFTTQAERTFTDQIGREVKVPDKVDRIVVLQHQTLNLLVQMNATDKIVGVMSNWKQQLGSNYARLAPELVSKASLGDLTHVDAEKLVALHPQVVFVTNYAPQEMIDKISSLGIPAVAISLRHDDEGEKNKLNPTMADEEQAYVKGLYEGIMLIGNIINKPEEAKELIKATENGRNIVSERLQNLPEEKRIRAYMANPELTTYGSGKYTGLMMKHAGAVNVAASTIKGFKQVSMEQVIAWNPQVIFVQNRYPGVVNEIRSNPQWQVIDAVKNHRVYLMPEYAKAWGYPMPEAMGIGELWMAKKLYPEKFNDIDMHKIANDWYRKFYRTNYQGE